MFNNKIIFSFLLLLISVKSFCQPKEFTSQPTRGQYSLVMYISGGAGYFGSNKGSPAYLQPTVSRVNPVSTIRILWHPNHLLKAGLETGYITFYTYHLKDSAGNSGKLALNAIPLLIEWSMSVTKRFNVFAGSGAYLLNTQLNYAGKSASTKFSVGWMAAASYIIPLSKNTGLGAEGKWLYAAETSNGSFCFQLQYVWKFLKW